MRWILHAVLIAATPSFALTVPHTGSHVQASGYLDVLGVVPTEDSRRQRPQGLAVLRLDADVSEHLQGRLELRGRLGGPFEGGHPGVFNLAHTFQNYSPSLEIREGYVDWRTAAADFRVGIQQFAWGRLDGVPPTDVLNPRDYHDPFVTDFEEAKIGIPAVQATRHLPDVPRLSLGELRATLVYVPFAVPSRLPLLEERWFPGAALARGPIRLRKLDLERQLDEALLRRRRACLRRKPASDCLPHDSYVVHDVSVYPSYRTGNHHAPHTFASGAIAFRLGGTWRDVDWNLSHYTGPETGPDLAINPIVVDRYTTPNDGIFEYDPKRLDAPTTLAQQTSTIHMTGLDWATQVGATAVRGELAVFQDRPYLRTGQSLVDDRSVRSIRFPKNLAQKFYEDDHFDCTRSGRACRGAVDLGDLFVRRDSVEWGIGADYLTHGVFLLGQLNQVVLLERAPRLVIGDPETRWTTVIRRRFLQDRLELEVRGVYTIERGGWFVFPRAAYTIRDGLRLRVGYLAIGGTRNSLIGQFGRNDQLVLELRYGF